MFIEQAREGLIVENAIPILILVAALFAYFYFRSPTVKGAMGEARVNSRLQSALNADEYTILNDLTLPANGGSTQVDHVVVSIYGIFVVETKNMKGWIFGGEKQARWTVTLRRHKSQFQNPLRQNYKHVKTIQELLSLRESDLYNLVVFVGSAEPKTEMPENVLWSEAQLSKYIRSMRTAVFSHSQVRSFVSGLQNAALESSRATKREHIRSVKAQGVDRVNDATKCPRCSSNLVERTNKKTGQSFLGCSRFPKCKGTRQV